MQRTLPVRIPSGKSFTLIPILADTIKLRQKWQQPKPKREPFTWEIFEAFHKAVLKATKHDKSAYLDSTAACFDWLCLGCFTGSRAGEYAQTVAPKGQYSKVPASMAAGKWQNTPIAFMLADFTLYDKYHRKIHISLAILTSGAQVCEVHISFRFDKGKLNFQIRKFRRTGSFLCPVEAVLSILLRAHILQVPAHEPLGVYRCDKKGNYTYLRSTDIITTVRKICVLAYPDKNHYLRVNITSLVAHSNRVTAAMALRAMGKSIEEIAFRIRWAKESVEYYLRECSFTIDDLTACAIHGAMVL